jgi:signal transduction histidine kinase
LDSDLPPVAVDPRSLHRALLHLVLNARDALRGSGRIVVSARMLSGPGGRYVEIAVTENAAGIPRDRGERALERSYISGDLSRSPAAGLVQVRDFVERCGGCVRIDCRKEGGTRVRMQLPTLSDARARVDFVEHRLERATA